MKTYLNPVMYGPALLLTALAIGILFYAWRLPGSQAEVTHCYGSVCCVGGTPAYGAYGWECEK